jgi:hypothetical protein
VVRGPWSVVCGPWSVVRGLWSVVCGPWSVVRSIDFSGAPDNVESETVKTQDEALSS